ncbi:hypothetical protein A2Z33_03670 [Candidatus Gottesmanbacteria bacterium RBG_16_52_11]|uniref:Glycosyltransferase RgtA/B/C/D-like domain-containing protein n=1 Tax=Candidatus Gottesmanbacteria bacterium RBG_16_52_11 TaxID=1798374 RepID=A0A1F5YWE3_9BACT|nr:MAG: hypothetical protein A2Z33_03670 [Candidatus Gottesmanbacteria bacterium RBG_16_52_11]
MGDLYNTYVFSLTDPRLFLYWIYFLGAVILAFAVPGAVLLRRFKPGLLMLWGVGIPMGIALWAWQGYIFGYLNIRWASYLYLLVFVAVWVWPFVHRHRRPKPKSVISGKPDAVSAGIVVLGALFQLFMILFTAVRYRGTMYFCCAMVEDNWWFAAIARELVRHFPPMQPGMYGVPLANYHYWSNLVVAELSRVFGLPILHTQFQFMGLLLALTLGVGVMALGNLFFWPRNVIRWMLFFFYFGSDAIYWLLLGLGKGMSFSMNSLENGTLLLANLPRAYAVVVLIAAIGLIHLVHTSKDRWIWLVTALVLASLAGLKIYVAVFAYTGLVAATLYLLATRQPSGQLMRLGIATGILALVVYIPTNSTAGGLFYTGFWRFENFIVQEQLGLSRWELARVVFAEHRNLIRALGYDLWFFTVYTAATFGTKLLGLFQTRRSLRMIPGYLQAFLIGGMAVSFVAGGFFQQRVGSSNTFNFLVNVFIFGSLYAGLGAWQLSGMFPRPLSFAIVTLIVAVTIPRSISEVQKTYAAVSGTGGFHLNRQVEEGLVYLRDRVPADAIVAVDTDDLSFDHNSPTVSFLADKTTYYSGMGLLKHFNMDTFDRDKTMYAVFRRSDPRITAALLRGQGINYLLVATPSAIPATESGRFLTPVFQNEKVSVLKVMRDSLRPIIEAH